MNDAEWEKEERRLRTAATRAANIIRNCRCTLVAKLLLVNKRKAADEALRLHRLNRFELVK